jgi:hypothetical protein
MGQNHRRWNLMSNYLPNLEKLIENFFFTCLDLIQFATLFILIIIAEVIFFVFDKL